MFIDKLFACLVITIVSNFSVTAQHNERVFKKFKGEVSVGSARPVNSYFSPGSLIALEPKYAIKDKLYVGLRLEGVEVDRIIDYGSSLYSHENKVALSFPATADYYFTNNYSFRPFLGIGAGPYGVGIDGYEFEFKFGGLARAGAELKHVRLAVEYNMVPGSNIITTSYDNLGNPVTITEKITNNYLGLKVGFCFGGGRL